MNLKDIIESLALGAFVGCFILCLVEIMISLIAGPALAFQVLILSMEY